MFKYSAQTELNNSYYTKMKQAFTLLYAIFSSMFMLPVILQENKLSFQFRYIAKHNITQYSTCINIWSSTENEVT